MGDRVPGLQEVAAQDIVGKQAAEDPSLVKQPAAYMLRPDPSANANLMLLAVLRLPFKVPREPFLSP